MQLHVHFNWNIQMHNIQLDVSIWIPNDFDIVNNLWRMTRKNRRWQQHKKQMNWFRYKTPCVKSSLMKIRNALSQSMFNGNRTWWRMHYISWFVRELFCFSTSLTFIDYFMVVRYLLRMKQSNHLDYGKMNTGCYSVSSELVLFFFSYFFFHFLLFRYFRIAFHISHLIYIICAH